MTERWGALLVGVAFAALAVVLWVVTTATAVDEGPCPTGSADCTVVRPHPAGGGS